MEAETIQSLVNVVPGTERELASPNDVDLASLQASWNEEKQVLLDALQSLKDLVAATGRSSLVNIAQ